MDDFMYFDKGTTSFLAEVIGIVAPTKLYFDFPGPAEGGHRLVRAEFEGVSATTGREFKTTACGRSYGQVLRAIRDDLRQEFGE